MEAKPLAFQFSKSIKKSNVVKTSLNTIESNNEIDFVKSVDDSVIESTKKRKESEGPLVIPLKKRRIEQNGERTSPPDVDEQQSSASKDGGLELQAAEELLKESAEKDKTEEDGKHIADISVSVSNIAQGAFIGEVSSLADYDDVPVQEFGKALLRGMGWKEGGGVGKKGEFVAPVEVAVRPKGLGLGASVTSSQTAKPAAEGEEELAMVPGAYVLVSAGKEKGCYGQVTSLDGDGRALVKMAISGNTSSLLEAALQLVTKKDYRRNSKVINQDKYQEYRDKQEQEQEKSRAQQREGERESARDRDRDSHSDRDRDSHGDRDRDRDSHRDQDRKRHGDQRKKPKHSRSEKSESDGRPANSLPWARPHLRVRCIDQGYKKGRYYKEKVTVVDVVTSEQCVCEDASGRLLEGVSTRLLETVVPRQTGAHVMVVRGPQRGQVGAVLERDTRRCRTTVQLLPDQDLHTLDYDDVCEYTGSMEAYT